MRNELYTPKLGKPLNNNVLVEVTDIFNQIVTGSGIILPNLSDEESKGDSPGYSFSEFIIRYGKVISVPEVITPGSFDYDTKVEVKEGDVVYWNSFSFLDSQPLVMEDRKFLLVDYHELQFRMRDGFITPVNGNVLLTPVPEVHEYGEFEHVIEKTNKWIIWKKPEKLNKELNPNNYTDDIWDVGDRVILTIMDKPFKIEGDILCNLEEKIYSCPLRMIICEV